MIDELNTIIEIKPLPEILMQVKEPFEYNGIQFVPQWHENGIITYSGMLENLKLNFHFNRLFIKNSWHKYYLGNNYTDYKFSDIEETFYKLENTIKINLDCAKINRIAYGCVINENPYSNYPNWRYLKNTIPQPMMKNGRQYGCYFPFNDYKLKGYDKSFEVWKHDRERLQGNYFRIEKEVKYMRYLQRRTKNRIQLHQVKDIFTKDILTQLADDLLKTYGEIEKKINMDKTNLSLSDLKILAVMQDKDFREHLRATRQKTYKNYKKRIMSLSDARVDDYFEKVKFKIEDKLNFLINS